MLTGEPRPGVSCSPSRGPARTLPACGPRAWSTATRSSSTARRSGPRTLVEVGLRHAAGPHRRRPMRRSIAASPTSSLDMATPGHRHSARFARAADGPFGVQRGLPRRRAGSAGQRCPGGDQRRVGADPHHVDQRASEHRHRDASVGDDELFGLARVVRRGRRPGGAPGAGSARRLCRRRRSSSSATGSARRRARGEQPGPESFGAEAGEQSRRLRAARFNLAMADDGPGRRRSTGATTHADGRVSGRTTRSSANG